MRFSPHFQTENSSTVSLEFLFHYSQYPSNLILTVTDLSYGLSCTPFFSILYCSILYTNKMIFPKSLLHCAYHAYVFPHLATYTNNIHFS